ncbi:MAG: hypothetical protein J6S87_05305 [Bacteroidales bacterium]|nr:hypothetical protein [Bacteroidales bacterium]
MSLLSQYSLWFLPLCLLVGVGCAMLLYYKSTNLDLDKKSRIIMSCLRGLAVSLICFLLLAPMLKMVVKELDKPLIIFAVDNSESIVLSKDSAYYRQNYPQQLNQLVKSFGDKYDVKVYSVGEKNQLQEDKNTDFLDFKEKSTDLSSIFNEVSTLYGNRNVGSMIVLSDGIVNVGSNPYYKASSVEFPVYTVGLGSTETTTDLFIAGVNHNKQALKGNYFPVEIKIAANQLANNNVTLTLEEGNEVLMSKNMTINSRKFFETVTANIQATTKGLHKYKLSLTELDGELTHRNNTAYFYVEVIDSREKIAIVYNGPHPDVAAIKSALESGENYEVTVSSVQDFRASVDEYSLIILHQLPSVGQPAANLLSQIEKTGTSSLYIVGGQTNLPAFNNLNTGVSIQQNKNLFNNAVPLFNENFTAFTFSEEARQLLPKLPPVTTIFGDYKSMVASNVFLYQRINNVNTQYPLILFNDHNGVKTGVICGTGIWQWKLYNYLYTQGHREFDEIINKIATYLSVKADKSLFRVSAKNVYEEYKPVVITAELYNESYELVNDADVSIVITAGDGKKYEQQLSKQNNLYVLTMGELPVGDYSWTCSTKYGRNSYSKSGSFSVDEVLIESTNLVADHSLLQSIATATNGKFFLPQDMQQIEQEIKNNDNIKPIANYSKKYNLLLSSWVYFACIVLLLGIEWFLRKWNGGI